MTQTSETKLSCLVVSDFTITSFCGILGNDDQFPHLAVREAPFGGVFSTLLSLSKEEETNKPEAIIVWTRPQATLPTFAQMLQGEHAPLEAMLAEVDAFANLLLAVSARIKLLFVPTWVLPPFERGLGLLNMLPANGWAYMVMRLNLRLSERLAEAPNVYPLDTFRWLMNVGGKAVNPKQWYLGKVAFSQEVFKEATLDIKAGLSSLYGGARKLVVVDLDNTLWGGTVGEDGWQDLVLGGHDALGEAFIDFQRSLKRLSRYGVLLGIVSKNEEAVALEALREHPEMVLRPGDFVGWRINWGDKAQNLVDLVANLNLGLQSVVFVDDSSFERARIRDTLPEVLVPEWPASPMHFVKALCNLRCFDPVSLTDEDRMRTEMYITEKRRQSGRRKVGSIEEWLQSLELRVQVEPLNEANMGRVVQLLNKTNQMNLRTRRMDETALRDWLAEGERRFWAFRVMDKFGDSGLTALLSLESQGDEAEVVDFVVSCRVFQRGVEEAMLHYGISFLRKQGVRKLCAKYLRTKKNKPCLTFWKERSGFRAVGEALHPTFTWELDKPYEQPRHLKYLIPDPAK